jgi:hypothetical protein
MTQQAFQIRRMGKFRRASESPETFVDAGLQGMICLVQGLRIDDLFAPGGRLRAAHGLNQGVVLLADIRAPLPVRLGNPLEDLLESRHAEAALFGKVGASVEGRVVIGGEKHRQRPAAGPLGEQLVGRLVDLVEVGTLFAIHFDVDEMLVHDLRGGIVLEGFVRHDVAPMACRVAHRQQNGFVLGACFFQRFLRPRVPRHRVVRVLEQVRAGFAGEGILFLSVHVIFKTVGIGAL